MATSINSRPWLQHYPDGVPATINYREGPLYSILADAAAAHPNLPAIRFYATQLNYGQLWAQAQRFAAALAELGVQKGDRVALMLPNCPQYVIAYYGTLRAGAVAARFRRGDHCRRRRALSRGAGGQQHPAKACSRCHAQGRCATRT